PEYEEDEADEEVRPRRKKRGTSGKAIASLILGILGIVPCLIFTGIPALIFGFLGLRDVNESRGRLGGRGLAITRLVLGGLSIALTVFAVPVLLLVPAAQKMRDSADRAQGSNNLKVIGIALHNYHDNYQQFPPAVVYSADGKPLYSWRVLILPFIEQ